MEVGAKPWQLRTCSARLSFCAKALGKYIDTFMEYSNYIPFVLPIQKQAPIFKEEPVIVQTKSIADLAFQI